MSRHTRTRRDLVGASFGRWLVIGRAEDYIFNCGTRRPMWLAQCSCGSAIKAVMQTSLLSGRSTSCGCHHKEKLAKVMTKHGKHKSKEYQSWADMIQRCTNPKVQVYGYYGGRGITVCDRWLNSFENFLEDMGECAEGMSLDRIDFDGNYHKENCRWASLSVQSFNQRKSIVNKSGKTGVSKLGSVGKWKATITKDKKVYNIGIFATFEEAVAAREKAEIELYGFNKE